jgi:hypothetical protein
VPRTPSVPKIFLGVVMWFLQVIQSGILCDVNGKLRELREREEHGSVPHRP